jgi:hypothetical protein
VTLKYNDADTGLVFSVDFFFLSDLGECCFIGAIAPQTITIALKLSQSRYNIK